MMPHRAMPDASIGSHQGSFRCQFIDLKGGSIVEVEPTLSSGQILPERSPAVAVLILYASFAKGEIHAEQQQPLCRFGTIEK